MELVFKSRISVYNHVHAELLEQLLSGDYDSIIMNNEDWMKLKRCKGSPSYLEFSPNKFMNTPIEIQGK